MQELKYPFFTPQRILKRESLEMLRDYPRDLLDASAEDLSDGIVCGLKPTVDKDILTFSKGIIKHNGRLYVIHQPAVLSYRETEIEVLIKLNFYDEIRDKDYETQFVEVEIDRDVSMRGNQIELGRFKLKKGAYLRHDYQDLYDFTTEYNTINVVHVLYAGRKEATLSAEIFRYFAREALEVRPQEAIDISFCLLCMNSARVERQAAVSYIGYKLEEEFQELTNAQIHDKLVKILSKIKQDNAGLKRKRPQARGIRLD